MPLTRQQIYRRRRITIFGAAAIVLGTAFYLPMTLLAPVDDVAASVLPYESTAQAAADVDMPDYGASGVGAVGMDGLLASAGTDDPLPIASISKIITTLVVLDEKPIADGEDGETLTFTDEDVQVYYDYIAANGSVKAVSAGMQLSEKQVIELMLIGSANNYAHSLVDWAFGSEDDYADVANAWLTTNGLTSTSITDATGMSSKNTSTPADLVKLGELALANPVIADVVSMKSASIPNVGEFDNTNKLLGVDGIDGIKTGTTDDAGSCLLFATDITVGSKTITLVGVVLNGPSHDTIDDAVLDMLDGVEAGFHEVTLTTQGDEFASYTTEWGSTAEAVASEDATAVVWSDTPVTALVQADPVGLADSGSAVGSVSFAVGDTTVKVPLTLDATIDDPGAAWRLTNPGALF